MLWFKGCKNMVKIHKQCWAWWYTPVIPALRGTKAVGFQVWGQPGLRGKTPYKKINEENLKYGLQGYIRLINIEVNIWSVGKKSKM
jgi:hypothetical protein